MKIYKVVREKKIYSESEDDKLSSAEYQFIQSSSGGWFVLPDWQVTTSLQSPFNYFIESGEHNSFVLNIYHVY